MYLEDDGFTWNIQKAGYDFDKVDEMGKINFENYLMEFENFPWIEQLEFINKTQEGCAPTMSVVDHETGWKFWISMGGSSKEYFYVLGFICFIEINSFLGFGKPKIKEQHYSCETTDKKLVLELIKVFFERDFDKLQSTIASMETNPYN